LQKQFQPGDQEETIEFESEKVATEPALDQEEPDCSADVEDSPSRKKRPKESMIDGSKRHN